MELAEQVRKLGAKAVLQLIVDDPPDLNYGEIYTPHVPTIPLSGLDALTPEQAGVVQRTFALESEFLATMQAMLVTCERVAGAHEAHDVSWTIAQDKALGDYVVKLGDLSDELVLANQHMASVVQELGMADIALEVSDVEAFQESLRDGGLPQEELDLLALFHIDPELVQPEVDRMIALESSRIAGVTLGDTFVRTAQMYQRFSDAIHAVPEPGIATLIVCGILVCLMRWRHWK